MDPEGGGDETVVDGKTHRRQWRRPGGKESRGLIDQATSVNELAKGLTPGRGIQVAEENGWQSIGIEALSKPPKLCVSLANASEPDGRHCMGSLDLQ